jgi:aldehyde dehydrogenase (NAD+)
MQSSTNLKDWLASGKIITQVSVGTSEDIEVAAQAARIAYKQKWGLRVPGAERSKLLHKLADLIEASADRLAALEALNVGQSVAPHVFL